MSLSKITLQFSPSILFLESTVNPHFKAGSTSRVNFQFGDEMQKCISQSVNSPFAICHVIFPKCTVAYVILVKSVCGCTQMCVCWVI